MSQLLDRLKQQMYDDDCGGTLIYASINRIQLYEKALQEIIDLPSVRQDECCNIAMNAMDTDE